jgi:hypothetical protein
MLVGSRKKERKKPKERHSKTAPATIANWQLATAHFSFVLVFVSSSSSIASQRQQFIFGRDIFKDVHSASFDLKYTGGWRGTVIVLLYLIH